MVQLFQLTAEVSNQFILGMQRQIGIALLAQQPDKFFLQFRLALVAVRAHLGGFIGSNNRIFIGSRNDIEKDISSSSYHLSFRYMPQFTI